MDELFPNRCMLTQNKVEETWVWTGYSDISSKYYSNKCQVREKQNMFSK